MRKILLTAFLLGVALTSSRALADMITLKTGERVEGTIQSETDAEVTIEVQVSPTISDQRTYSRDEIASVSRTAPDDIEFQEIKNIKPDPQNSLAPAAYDLALARLREFLTKYPKSQHAWEIQANIEALQTEKRRVTIDKEVKYLGQWLNKEQAENRAVQIEALQLFNAMKDQAAHGDVAGALATFERIEKNGNGTRIFPDALEFARQLLPQLQQFLAERKRTLAYEQEEFKKTLAMQSEPEKSDTQRAYQREQAQYDATVEAALKSGSKWPPLILRSAKSIDELDKTAASEKQRLATIQPPVQKMRDSITLVDQAKSALYGNDLKTAESLLKSASTAWPQNEEATYYATQVAAALKAAAATPTPAPKPGASASPGAAKAGASPGAAKASASASASPKK